MDQKRLSRSLLLQIGHEVGTETSGRNILFLPDNLSSPNQKRQEAWCMRNYYIYIYTHVIHIYMCIYNTTESVSKPETLCSNRRSSTGENTRGNARLNQWGQLYHVFVSHSKPIDCERYLRQTVRGKVLTGTDKLL